MARRLSARDPHRNVLSGHSAPRLLRRFVTQSQNRNSSCECRHSALADDPGPGEMGPALANSRHSRLPPWVELHSTQLIKQRLRVLRVGGIESLGESGRRPGRNGRDQASAWPVKVGCRLLVLCRYVGKSISGWCDPLRRRFTSGKELIVD